jgi:hypothetical protein
MTTEMGRRESSGWITFSGTMLIIVGFLDIVDGLWAIDKSDSTRTTSLLYYDDLAGWGWFYLFLGIFLVLVGIGVLFRSQVARWLGVFAASVAIVANMLWVFEYPGVVIIHILLASLVVYGLVASRDIDYWED